MHKHTALIARQAGVSHEEFVGYWLRDHVPTARQLPGLVTYATVLPLDLQSSTYDGMMELSFENHGQLRAWLRWSGAGRYDPDHPYRKEAREDLRRFAPEQNRREFVGETTVRKDDTDGSTHGLFKHTAFLVRRGGMDHEDFREKWLHDHVPKAKSIPGVVKCVTGEPLNPAKVEFDAVTELYFEDHRALESALGYAGSPEFQPEHPMAKEARAGTLDFLSVENCARFVGEETIHTDTSPDDTIRSVHTGSGGDRGSQGPTVESGPTIRGPDDRQSGPRSQSPPAGQSPRGPDSHQPGPRDDRSTNRRGDQGDDEPLTSTMLGTSISPGGDGPSGGQEGPPGPGDGPSGRRDDRQYDSLDRDDGPGRPDGEDHGAPSDPAAQVRRSFPELGHIEDGELRRAVVDTWVSGLEAGGWDDITAVPFAPALSDVSNAEHVRGVAATAIRLAEVLGESHGLAPDIDLLRAVALIHDVGKCVAYAGGSGTDYERATGDVPTALSSVDLARQAGCPDRVLAALPDENGVGSTGARPVEQFLVRSANAASATAITETTTGTPYETWVTQHDTAGEAPPTTEDSPGEDPPGADPPGADPPGADPTDASDDDGTDQSADAGAETQDERDDGGEEWSEDGDEWSDDGDDTDE